VSTFDDFPGDMEAFPFTERESDAVFGAPGADVPDSLREVADLVQAARRPGSADELAGSDELVAGIAAAIGEHAAPLPSVADERIRVLNKVRTAKAAAAATVVLMLGGTAAAAATGTLPAPVAHHHAELASAEMSTGATGATGATGPHGHHGKHHGLSGTVASVNGSTDPTMCGTGDTGTFTLTGHHGDTFTVNVAPTTTYFSKHVTDASFANVCVGARVKVKGMVDGTTVAADKVRIKHTKTANHDEHGPQGAFIVPPQQPDQPAHEQHDGVNGSVVSVNGSTDPAACGSGDTGSFTVTDHDGNTFTVNVSPNTTFGHGHGHDDVQAPAPAQSFADVCVGKKVGAKGAVTDTTVAADMVFVRGDHNGDHEGDHEGDDAENHDTASAEHDGEPHQAATSGQDSGGDHHDGSGDQGSGDHGSGHDD
jgi:hypothetical protein